MRWQTVVAALVLLSGGFFTSCGVSPVRPQVPVAACRWPTPVPADFARLETTEGRVGLGEPWGPGTFTGDLVMDNGAPVLRGEWRFHGLTVRAQAPARSLVHTAVPMRLGDAAVVAGQAVNVVELADGVVLVNNTSRGVTPASPATAPLRCEDVRLVAPANEEAEKEPHVVSWDSAARVALHREPGGPVIAHFEPQPNLPPFTPRLLERRGEWSHIAFSSTVAWDGWVNVPTRDDSPLIGCRIGGIIGGVDGPWDTCSGEQRLFVRSEGRDLEVGRVAAGVRLKMGSVVNGRAPVKFREWTGGALVVEVGDTTCQPAP